MGASRARSNPGLCGVALSHQRHQSEVAFPLGDSERRLLFLIVSLLLSASEQSLYRLARHLIPPSRIAPQSASASAMPPRRRQRAKTPVEEEEEEEQEVAQEEQQPESDSELSEPDDDAADERATPGNGDEGLAKLQFDEELSWKPAKPIPTATLLSRLERLSKELTDLEQDATDLDSLRDVAAKLANRNLIQHKDRGVRAYAACCLVDLLELFAPEAPFTDDQLKVRPSRENDAAP